MSSAIRVGEDVDIRLPAIEHALRTTITRFTHHIDADTRTMEVECDLDNADQRMIPGMFATVTLRKSVIMSAVTIPVEAIVRRDGEVSAMVLDKDDRVIQRAIRLGMQTAEVAQVTEGIAADDLVVTAKQDQLRDGIQVSPQLILARASIR